MKLVTYDEICAMKGNGASMRHVLKYFIEEGAKVYVLHENIDEIITRFFIVDYKDVRIPLRAYKHNFYSAYNSALAHSLTSDKAKTYSLLTSWNIPTPITAVYDSSFDDNAFFNTHKLSVVKPAAIAAGGDGITLGINNRESLSKALAVAQDISPNILIQQQVEGDDHRLLFINYRFVAAVKRLPASIQGDGNSTAQELIDKYNDNISRLWEQIHSGDISADSTRGSTSKISVKEVISARGRDFLDFIPAKDSNVRLIDKANVSLGGQTYDVTDDVNPDLANKLSELLKVIGLPLCGIDVLSKDISSPPDAGNSFVIELNAAPGLRLHELPFEGMSRPVCAMVAEALAEYHKNLLD